MTSKQFRALTPEQQLITVAELAGWKEIAYRGPDGRYGLLTGRRSLNVPLAVPEYLHDLNAMRDAVASVVKQRGVGWTVTFNHCLYEVLGHHDHVEHEAIHATARQRAEAFVLAMEKG